VNHGDSLGNRGRLGAGDVRGILHQEMPQGEYARKGYPACAGTIANVAVHNDQCGTILARKRAATSSVNAISV
jgi:hypothetical protein